MPIAGCRDQRQRAAVLRWLPASAENPRRERWNSAPAKSRRWRSIRPAPSKRCFRACRSRASIGSAIHSDIAGDRQEASNAIEVGSAADRLAVSGLGANRGAGMTIARGLAMDPLAAVPTTLGLADGGAMLSITWADGRASLFPAIWLADNRPESRRGPEGQRLTDALELPETVALRSATIVAAGGAIPFSCFERPSVFDAAWLRDPALDAVSRAERRREPQLWDIGLA